MENQDSGSNKSTSSYLCRQSSTRWTPTSDQIRILKELYYNNGIRSPTADQIQRIAARLRHYGKIEGKNVFYWFQNHKARERQKKRFTPGVASTTTTTATAIVPSQYMHVQSHHLPYFYNHHQFKLHPTHHILPPEGGSSSSSSSQAFVQVGCGYGAIAMENSFRDCSISPGDNMVPYSFDKLKPENLETAEEDEDGEDQIETLPLFPIPAGGGSTHEIFKLESSVSSEQRNGSGYYSGGNWFHSDGRTSLELSLNSYGYN